MRSNPASRTRSRRALHLYGLIELDVIDRVTAVPLLCRALENDPTRALWFIELGNALSYEGLLEGCGGFSAKPPGRGCPRRSNVLGVQN